MKNITLLNNKIIICKGDVHTPANYWMWAVCTEEEFTSEWKEHGWVKSTCVNYLSTEQMAYLDLRTQAEENHIKYFQ